MQNRSPPPLPQGSGSPRRESGRFLFEPMTSVFGHQMYLGNRNPKMTREAAEYVLWWWKKKHDVIREETLAEACEALGTTVEEFRSKK